MKRSTLWLTSIMPNWWVYQSNLQVFVSTRSFYDITEKYLHCSRSLEEDGNQMQILSMLKSKLPSNALLELEKMKPENEEWTVKSFRKILKRHVEAQEDCNIQMKLFHKPDKSPKPLYTPRFPPQLQQLAELYWRQSIVEWWIPI